ncbi:MAG: HK97 gp10 family phage protein [Clostridium sp.]
MNDGFDISELTDFEEKLMKLANDKMPKESKKFLKKEGKSLLQETQAEAIFSGIKHKDHKYYNSIKQGKVYKYRGSGAFAIRVYSSAPHAHLIEDGHRMVTHDGKEVGFVKGFRVFDNAEKSFTSKYYNDCQKFIDDVLEKGL